MNKDYRYMLLSKLYKLRGLYIEQSQKTNPHKEFRLYALHVPKVTEFYERNKSKELLDFLLKSKNYKDINTLLTQAEHIAKQTSGKRRRILANACLKGLGSDYSSLYIVSNQSTTNEMKEMIKIYFSNDRSRSELMSEAKQKLLKRMNRRY